MRRRKRCFIFVILTPRQIQYGGSRRASLAKSGDMIRDRIRILCLLFLLLTLKRLKSFFLCIHCSLHSFSCFVPVYFFFVVSDFMDKNVKAAVFVCTYASFLRINNDIRKLPQSSGTTFFK